MLETKRRTGDNFRRRRWLGSQDDLEAAHEALARARDEAGGASRLARLINGISSQAVTMWDVVPAERVLRVEEVTGISRHELRPDLYPPPKRGRKL